MARREGALAPPHLQQFWPMVERAAGFVLRTGPRTQQDRWEENAGYTPFTLAVAVASLLAAAEIAEACDIEALPALLRDTADAWNEQIEDWIYVEDTPLGREAGVRGYYIRVAPPQPAPAHHTIDPAQLSTRARASSPLPHACSRSNCLRGLAGAAITSTATAGRRTEAPSTGSGSAASGRSWRANERTTRLRRGSAKRRRRCSRQSRRRQALAA